MENGPSDVKLPKIRQEASKNTRSDGKSPKIRQEAGKNGRSDGKSPKIRQEAVAPTCGGGSGPLGDAAAAIRGQCGRGKPTRLPINGFSIICH